MRNATRADFTYRLGVMVETPRAALRAGEIAAHADFLSFGTNDLTQMTYGLSRDDAGRFMGAYVRQGVFAEDPFHTLDTEGVGELLQIGAARGRAARPEITLAVCGEHGGNPEFPRLPARYRLRLCELLALSRPGRPARRRSTCDCRDGVSRRRPLSR